MPHARRSFSLFWRSLPPRRTRSRIADVRTNTPEEFAAFIRSEKEKWAKVVKVANVKIE